MKDIFLSRKYKSYDKIKPQLDKEKKKAVNKGKKEGRLEGLTEDEKVGKAEGLKQGKKNKAVEMAKSTLADNMDIKIISKHTGFSKEEI